MDVSKDLGAFKPADDENNHTLKIVWIDKEILRRYFMAVPEQIKLFADLPRATIVNPFKLAHRIF